jgi:hypothetical protein
MSLDLSYNSIYGFLPDINLASMEYLDLHLNEIFGTIHDFQRIPNIRHLKLDGNPLSGTVPDFSGIPSTSYILIGQSGLIRGLIGLKVDV